MPSTPPAHLFGQGWPETATELSQTSPPLSLSLTMGSSAMPSASKPSVDVAAVQLAAGSCLKRQISFVDSSRRPVQQTSSVQPAVGPAGQR